MGERENLNNENLRRKPAPFYKEDEIDVPLGSDAECAKMNK
jgi:hypothetical protein